jgi:hypothetical protein
MRKQLGLDNSVSVIYFVRIFWELTPYGGIEVQLTPFSLVEDRTNHAIAAVRTSNTRNGKKVTGKQLKIEGIF